MTNITFQTTLSAVKETLDMFTFLEFIIFSFFVCYTVIQDIKSLLCAHYAEMPLVVVLYQLDRRETNLEFDLFHCF